MTPASNWPDKPGHYKVVQLWADDKLYIGFGDLETSYHSIILGNMLDDLGIAFDFNDLGEPNPAGKRYRVSGMGKMRLLGERQALFYGNSFAYRIGIDKQHIDAIAALHPGWKLSVR